MRKHVIGRRPWLLMGLLGLSGLGLGLGWASDAAGQGAGGQGTPPGIKPPSAAPTSPPAQAGPTKPPPTATTPKPPVPRPAVANPFSRVSPAGPTALRWVAPTPDQMILLALRRARADGPEGLAGLLVAYELADSATHNLARKGLETIGRLDTAMASEARLLALRLAPAKLSPWAGADNIPDAPGASDDGIITSLGVLGPFEDTGGGLDRKEGPELDGERYLDMEADYSWGAYAVTWRRSLPGSVGARGVPLDVYVTPREESCSYLASKITLPPDHQGPLHVRVAAAGAVRVAWNGVEIARDEETHRNGVVDRVAASITPSGDAQVVSAKVCSSALGDTGRVRLRITDPEGKPIPILSDGRAMPAASLAAPTAIQPVTTPFQAAVAMGEGDDSEGALVAAATRILAGADDSRAARSPGLLSRVADAAEPTPDELAMTGWLSPFGAHKSGRLNEARALAEDRGDQLTLGFAQRELAEGQLRSGHVDWARSTLSTAPFSEAKDAHAEILRAMVLASEPASGMERAAVEALQAVAAKLKQRTPVSVLRYLARSSAAAPAEQLEAAKRLSTATPTYQDSRLFLAHAPLGAAAMERVASDVLVHAPDAREIVDMGTTLLRLGRQEWARELLYVATEVSPNLPDAHRGLAEARAAIVAREKLEGLEPTESDETIASALQRAVDLSPSDETLQAQLAFRRSDGSAETMLGLRGMRDERFLPSPDVFLARMKAKPAKVGEVAHRELTWTRVVTYHDDRRVSQLMHYAREIVVEPRTERELEEHFPGLGGDETELLIARVHKANGDVLDPDEYSSGSMPYVRWPKLERGDVVEVATRSWTGDPVGRRGDPPYYFIDYVGSTETQPVLFNEVIVDLPKGSPFAIDVINGKPDRDESTEENGRVVRKLTWDDPPALPDEPLSPPLSETLPLVVGSTYAGWDAFREWYTGAVLGFSEPDDEIRRLAAELTQGKATQDEKIEALFNFVADDIRYVNYVSGEWWLPNRPQQLLARRQGDCDDKAMLLISLLSVIGVDATPVLVQTRYTGMPSVLSSTKVAVPLFDHGIAFIPGKNGGEGLWLDATSPQSRIGPLPAMDARARAFFVEEGPAIIRETPPSSPEEHGMDARWTIELTPEGGGVLRAEESHRGDSAFQLRINLREADARVPWVERTLASGWFSSIQVEGDVAFEPDLAEGRATLAYEATSQGFARREDNELIVPLNATLTLTTQLAPLVKRTQPVVLPPSLAPGHRAYEVTLQAPKGFAFASPPPGGVVDGDAFGRASLSFERVNEAEMRVVRSIVFDQSTIPVEDYPAFRAWLQSIDAMLQQTPRLVVAP